MPSMIDDNDNNGSAIERFRRKQAEPGDSDDDTDDDTDGPSVTEEPDDIEGHTPVVETAPPKTRQEKKRERLKLRDELEATRREKTELESRLSRMEGRLEGMAALAPTGRPDRTEREDPLTAELERLHKEHKAEWAALQAKGANATQADRDAYENRYRALERQKGVIYAKQAMIESGVERQDPNAAQGAYMRMQYPDIYANQRAVGYAKAQYEAKLHLGREDSKELLEEVMSETRAAFRLGKAPPPSDRQRGQYAGYAPRGGGERGQGGDEGPVTIKMTKPLRIMATSMYPNLSESDAIKKWANTQGREMLKMNRGG